MSRSTSAARAPGADDQHAVVSALVDAGDQRRRASSTPTLATPMVSTRAPRGSPPPLIRPKTRCSQGGKAQRLQGAAAPATVVAHHLRVVEIREIERRRNAARRRNQRRQLAQSVRVVAADPEREADEDSLDDAEPRGPAAVPMPRELSHVTCRFRAGP